MIQNILYRSGFSKILQPFVDDVRLMVIANGYRSQSGHIGSALSCVEILSYIYASKNPKDIVILSKGHACLTQYCILAKEGKIPRDKLGNYVEELGGHPEINRAHGIHASTGSLGHGLAIGLGYAIADKTRDVYVVIGDGECDEGSIYEALKIKEELKVKNLIVVIDRNGLKGYGKVKVKAFLPDGNDLTQIRREFAYRYEKPVLEFKTVKGKGIKRFENELGSHYWKLTFSDIDSV